MQSLVIYAAVIYP